MIYVCNIAINNNSGIKNIIKALNKVNLQMFKYDFNKKLLTIFTNLATIPDFFDTGLKFMNEYEELGGLFSYGDEYYHFCNKLICNNLEKFCTLEKLRDLISSNSHYLKRLGTFLIGIILYKGKIGHFNKNETLNEYIQIMKYTKQRLDRNKVQNLIFSGIKNFYVHSNLIGKILFEIDEISEKKYQRICLLQVLFFQKTIYIQILNLDFWI